MNSWAAYGFNKNNPNNEQDETQEEWQRRVIQETRYKNTIKEGKPSCWNTLLKLLQFFFFMWFKRKKIRIGKTELCFQFSQKKVHKIIAYMQGWIIPKIS